MGQALAEGNVRSHGREMVYSNLRRQQGYRARQDDVWNALKLQDPVGTETRKPGAKRKRRLEYIVPGPNFLWSIDGHDKLASYGIEIYAAIDAYSRRILWFYVGNSNRTQLSVVRQFLNAVEHYNLCPDYIRSDRGSETPLVADAQYKAWDESLLLSEVIDTRPFIARASDGKKDPTIGVWLCFQPDEPSDCADSVPTPAPKAPKKKGKAGTNIKKENKKEIKKEAVDKRPRSAGSAEINRPAKRLPVRQGNAATQARAMEQVEEEDLLHAGDDVEDDLPPLEQLTGRK